MLYLASWLQDYIVESIPEKDLLTKTLSSKSLEVEGISDLKDGDYLLDVKVLPHRQSDCLSHRGLAYEIAALFNLTRKDITVSGLSSGGGEILVTIEDKERASRYYGVLLENISVTETNPHIKKRLEALGQRSISNVVDITNYVMLSIGQPMHAFDADKIDGSINVRVAAAGEKVMLLDGKEITLTGIETVIADDKGVLALAGVKGGMKAIVDERTSRIILESANFNPNLTRKTADLHNIRTDASKRYEAGITSGFAEIGMGMAANLLLESCKDAKVKALIDVYPGKEDERVHEVAVTLQAINTLLGSSYIESDIEDIFKREHFSFVKEGDAYKVTPPSERLDILIKEDLIEEIGRIMGYDDLPSVVPNLTKRGQEHKRLYYETKIKNVLYQEGFSEIYTYTFGDVGDVEIVKAVSDKKKLRTNLASGVGAALTMNLNNTPLLGVKTIKVFEFGNVFTKDSESRHFSLAIDDGAKKSNFAEAGDLVLAAIKDVLGGASIDYEVTSSKPYIVEIDFDALIAPLAEPTEPVFLSDDVRKNIDTTTYKSVSPYPFIVRDIAVWTDENVSWESLQREIVSVIQDDSKLLARPIELFDQFNKDGKVSYGFRLVLQSGSKTLTDPEANVVADKVYGYLKEKGYEIR